MPPTPVASSFGQVEAVCSAVQVAALRARAGTWGVTLASLLQTALVVTLERFAPGEEVSYGLTTAGRPDDLDGAMDLVGLFINTLPMRIAVEEGPRTLHALATRIQGEAAEAAAWGFLPLAEIMRCSDAARGRALFETLFVFKNYPEPASRLVDELGLAVHGLGGSIGVSVGSAGGRDHAEFPLMLVTGDAGEELRAQLMFDRRRYRDAFAARLMNVYQGVLGLLAGTHDLPGDWTATDVRGFQPRPWASARVLDTRGRDAPPGCGGRVTGDAGGAPAPWLATLDEDDNVVSLDHLRAVTGSGVIDQSKVREALRALPGVVELALDEGGGVLRIVVAALGDRSAMRRHARSALARCLAPSVLAQVRLLIVDAVPRHADGSSTSSPRMRSAAAMPPRATSSARCWGSGARSWATPRWACTTTSSMRRRFAVRGATARALARSIALAG